MIKKIFLVGLIFSGLSAQTDSLQEIKNVAEPNLLQTEAPKIDLPEFQITGTEFISLPDLKKDSVNEEKYFSTEGLLKIKKNLEVEQNNKYVKKSLVHRESMSGKFLLYGGNFGTHAIEGWFGKNYDEGGLLFHGYTNGLNDNTRGAESDKWGISINGNLLLNKITEINQPLRLRSEIEISKYTFNTFAATEPETYNLNYSKIKIGADSKISELTSFLTDFNFNTDLSLNTFSASQRNKELNENEIQFNGKSFINIFSLPIAFDLKYINPTLIKIVDSTFQYPFLFSNTISYQGNYLNKYSYKIASQIYISKGMDYKKETNFFPQLEFKYQHNSINSYSISFEPRIDYKNYREVFEVNPYLNLSSKYNFEKINNAIFAKSDLLIDSVSTLNAKIGFEKITNSIAFLEIDSNKTWNLKNVGEVNHFSLEFFYTRVLSSNSKLKSFFTINNFTSIDSSKTMPNISPLKFGAIYESEIIENLSFEAYLFYNSKKWSNFNQTKLVNSFVDVGAKAEYLIFDRLKVFGNISNLLNQKIIYWYSYREKGRAFLIGITYSW